MLLELTTAHCGFSLVYSCLKDPERTHLKHFTGTSCWEQACEMSHFKVELIDSLCFGMSLLGKEMLRVHLHSS